ncbi:uncharacterized protein LOC103313914 [Tribolium castaneum]|uniref:Uncharacterized protein n=1 Tax=Tribolium castaneum TaxID=7070 RepID=D6WVV5_TRICA|nr:PREDICTED: uncharacterized protein LOC103313914 isoform X1 [Tribolium castaneum]XP_015838008.1 PREDICTED: uncharacterized protein LOC103313914 isoform X2 [Tribolium castaneum]EFA08236.2 hypothetical protein TcasGA2_TC005864 [Tribolium castaneum]|eukprot:XP_008196644.1 PREDICTED: uncharacterized protein LOC103313914 isoform X1 [Tribolium castaneum]
MPAHNSWTSMMSGKPDLTIKSSVIEHQIQSVFARDSVGTQFHGRPKSTYSIRRFFRKSHKQLRAVQIESLKNQLIECCLTHIQDSYRVHLNRLKGLKILETFIHLVHISKISSELATHMVWACLSCIHHFLLRLKSEGGLMQWLRRKQARKSIRVFDNLMTFLIPFYYPVVFSAVITFFEEANIWDIEYFCSNLLERLFLVVDEKRKTDSMMEIISLIENSTLTNALTSRQILQVLFDIEQSLKWDLMNDRLLEKFLDMYYSSLTPEDNHEYNYESLEKGLETCLRAMCANFGEKYLMLMIRWMLDMTTSEKISDENLLNFGSLLEHVTTLYTSKSLNRNLPEQVFPFIFKLIASKNLLYSLLGNRVLHNLIDRCHNKLKFDAPRIFFRNSHYNIVLNHYNSTDKLLFQRYRELLHKTFVESVIRHGVHKIHLENIYISVVLFLVEIPCGYTAAAAVCLAMSIQEAALESKSIQMTHAHRLHAAVVSIMSLVCYIHKASVFYDYVDSIIDKRANFAPHLNPPLKIKYKYAQHHVLWNKPDLFFEDWETRYGLWRCFKNRHKDIVVVHT